MLIGVWVLINQGRIRFNFFRTLNGPRQRAKEAQAEGQRGPTEAVGVAKEDQRGVTEDRRSHTEALQRTKEALQSLYRASAKHSISLAALIFRIQFLWLH